MWFQWSKNCDWANDFTVMAAYGFDRKITESECVAELMRRYRELVRE
ncbi:MAG: hypothetical protein LIO74_03290 [Ruminococcus sp.]|nr:hypothetical protein [Ruminococcus sp.]